jgi:hypothetical protein
MHVLTLYGEEPQGTQTTLGVVKHLAEDCRLEWRQMLDTDEETGWEGPLLEVPDGTYYLWQGATIQLVVAKGKLLFNGRFIREQHTLNRLSQHVLNAFRSMLGSSTKRIHVYEDQQKRRKYLFLWPEATAPVEHPEGGAWLGTADLNTGDISK